MCSPAEFYSDRNYIGTDENGVQALGNDGYGVFIQGTSDNRVLGNLISGNGLGGVAVTGDTAEAQFATGVKSINFGGAGTGLMPGLTQIVATATDLAGNSSEFSASSRLASSALRKTSTVVVSTEPDPAQSIQRQATPASIGTRHVFDMNGDNRLNEIDALLVLSSINRSASTSGPTTSILPARMDFDSDGQVSLNDALLVIRGIQIHNLHTQSVAAIHKQTPTQLWDTSLIELIAQDLPSVKRALKSWPRGA